MLKLSTILLNIFLVILISYVLIIQLQPKDNASVANNKDPFGTSSKMLFTPVQCKETLWNEWYVNGYIKFAKIPTEKELIFTYYANVHDIEIKNYEEIKTADAVAMYCGNTKGYYILATVDDPQVLLGDGWIFANESKNSCRLWTSGKSIKCAKSALGDNWKLYTLSGNLSITKGCSEDENGNCELI